MKNQPPLLWRSESGNYRVRILRRCFRQMQRIAGQHAPAEVGTSLMGRYADSTQAVVISLGPLTPDSKGTRSTFVRGIIGLGEYFSRVRRRFRGQRYRVGEWHSHPGAAPIPSGTDDRNQHAIANDTKEDLPEAILVIIGGDLANAPSLGVYVYSRERGRVGLRPVA